MQQYEVREHWIALVKPFTVLCVILAIAEIWALGNLRTVILGLHLTQASPEIGYVKTFYNRGFLFVLTTLGIGGVLFFVDWTVWSITYYRIDNFAIIYKLGRFQENQIPLRSVQDITFTRGFLGTLLNFGKVTIKSGSEKETFKHIPDVEEFVAQIRPHSH